MAFAFTNRIIQNRINMFLQIAVIFVTVPVLSTVTKKKFSFAAFSKTLAPISAEINSPSLIQ